MLSQLKWKQKDLSLDVRSNLLGSLHVNIRFIVYPLLPLVFWSEWIAGCFLKNWDQLCILEFAKRVMIFLFAYAREKCIFLEWRRGKLIWDLVTVRLLICFGTLGLSLRFKLLCKSCSQWFLSVVGIKCMAASLSAQALYITVIIWKIYVKSI